MPTSSDSTGLAGRELTFFRVFFVIAALWNFAGSLPGTIDSAGMFEREFGRALTDAVMVAVYRGAWVTSLLYAFGFLIVAANPQRHTGIVAMGGLGKALFALNLTRMHLNGWTSDFAIVVIAGDAVFVAIFVLYFFRLKRLGVAII